MAGSALCLLMATYLESASGWENPPPKLVQKTRCTLVDLCKNSFGTILLKSFNHNLQPTFAEEDFAFGQVEALPALTAVLPVDHDAVLVTFAQIKVVRTRRGNCEEKEPSS